MNAPAQRGQASVELVAVLPLLAVVVAAVVSVLGAGSAREAAASAAQAGAMAMLQDADPRAAAEQALGPAAKRAHVGIEGRHVSVTVRPRALTPVVGRLLAATSSADAGPGAAAVAAGPPVRGGDGDGSRSPGARR